MFSALIQNLKKEIQVIFVSKRVYFIIEVYTTLVRFMSNISKVIRFLDFAYVLVGIILPKGCRISERKSIGLEGIYRSNKGIKTEL